MNTLLTGASIIVALVVGSVIGWTVADVATSPSSFVHLLVLR